MYAVLAYQFVIVVSLIVVRFVAPRLFLPTCLGWSAFSIFNLFFPPLLLLQLGVVWGTYALLRPRKRAEDPQPAQTAARVRGVKDPVSFAPLPSSAQPLKVAHAVPARQERPASLPGIQSEPDVDTAAHRPLREVGRLVAGGLHNFDQALIGVNKRLGEFNNTVERWLEVDKALREQTMAFTLERICIDEVLQSAEFTADLNRRLKEDEHYRKAYESTAQLFEGHSSADGSPGPKAASEPLKVPAEMGAPFPHPDPAIDALTQKKYRQLTDERTKYLIEVAHRLDHNSNLHDAFKELAMQYVGGEALLRRIPTSDIRRPSRASGDASSSLFGTAAARSGDALGVPTGAKVQPCGTTLSTVVKAEQKRQIQPLQASQLEPAADLTGPVGDRPAHPYVSAGIHPLMLDIPWLVHFTRAANLSSIMQSGLLSRTEAQRRGIEPHINDVNRWDDRLNATSMSIAFPNHRMFWRYRQESKGEAWVVLLLRSDILWLKRCAFCRHNAADRRMRGRNLDDLSRPSTFLELFEPIEGLPSREKQKLRLFHPTDVQAEILVLEPIEPESIIGAVFETEEAREAALPVLGNRRSYVQGHGRGLFAARSSVFADQVLA